jgi:predicted metal-binding protein
MEGTHVFAASIPSAFLFFGTHTMQDTHNNKYVKMALELGAVDAVLVTPDEIVFDGRTLLKCMFGCKQWGYEHVCPSRPGSLRPWEYEPLLRKYKFVLVIHAHDQHTTQNVSFALEREAFLDGDVMAFSMSDCSLCGTCAGHKGIPCTHMDKARPSFHSVGINVFATAHGLGLPIDTLKSKDGNEQQNWYAAVFLDNLPPA